ncbi:MULTISPECIES: MlaD family protein [unclassified Chelatococcus]|uniref:MlaD family protein n=1 Tax=unclassified Chelatococcus TaxID=2638111 RepID=UPI001BCD681F|nr:MULTISPECIES: MlaD family protein [unclassified Chelatococcus]MBS7698020.1 MCE family protein [Chelatococcus sp. YT9]MBX3556662.1 MCE family protein [Chelatococcus sp.]
METRANYALIGLFTLAVVTGAFLFVYWFAALGSGGTRESYRVVFTGSVSGLSRGASVLFNGLRIGEVRSISLLPEDPRHVVAIVDVDSGVPINSDTKARLEYQGLTGVASIQMTGGDPKAPPLVASAGQPMPTIYADRSDFQDLLETAQRLARRADDVLNKIDSVVGDAQTPIANTVRNVEKFSQALGDNSANINQLLSSAGDTAKSLSSLSTSLDAAIKAVDTKKIADIVNNVDRFTAALGNNSGDVQTILRNVNSLTAKLDRAADQVEGVLKSAQGLLSSPDGKGAFDQVAEAARAIRTLAINLDARTAEITAGIKRFTGPGLGNVEALTSDARRTLNDLNRTLQSVQRNPQQFIFGAKPNLPAYSGPR